jgi:hypothetical protein
MHVASGGRDLRAHRPSRHQPEVAPGRQDSCSVASTSTADSLDRRGEVDQGWPARHRAEAEADRWLDGPQRAEITALECGVDGDDGVQVVGAVPLPTADTGTATGADPRSSPAGSKV